jgi:hypothetical protein
VQTRSPILAVVLAASLVAGCAVHGGVVSPTSPLIGAWLVTSERGRGVGKNLLTFSSDRTFFRSGDTHPTLSGGHGAWKQLAPQEFEATYIAFRFDEDRKWVGSTKTTLRIKLGESADEFTGTAKSLTRDLDDKTLRSGESNLHGRRISVDPQ